MAPWVQDFDFYLSVIDGQPASFVVDLHAFGHAPAATHPVRVSLRVALQRPRADGLREADEMDAMGAVEDQIVEQLETTLGAIYVGRFVSAGATEMFAYLPAAHRAADLPSVIGDLPAPYQLAWQVEDDPAWTYCLEFLAPDPYAHQAIWNRRLVTQFETMGDQLAVAREIDHQASFDTRAAAAAAATALAALGYRVEDVAAPGQAVELDDGNERDDDDAPEPNTRWLLDFHRDDAIDDDKPDAFVGEILDVVLPLDGDYDGWGAGHVAPARSDASA